MFGISPPPQNEETQMLPQSPYGIAKLGAFHLTRLYRNAHGLFASNGILFNHESPRRGWNFVTKKITREIAKVLVGEKKKIFLGNLDAKRDWGFSKEYVEAMWIMLQKDGPGDFVIATNEAHSVREFCEAAFKVAGLDWQKYVKTDSRFLRKGEVNFLLGDYFKAKEKFGWEPKVKFNDLAKIMVDEDLNRWKKWQAGERFAFDAPYYPGEGNIMTRVLK